jgi:glycosyltransferase involved in cell wall biosynthesis
MGAVTMSRHPRLSVVVNFHDMRREAVRTLHTLSTHYQRGVDPGDYEVIAVDNGSSRPLDPRDVESHGSNFRYLRMDTGSPSPCAAINAAVAAATGDNIMVCIDGARMLSPGVLRYALEALGLHGHPFVYTLGMHLGPKPQNESMVDGYSREVEDALLETVDWRNDGYALFGISSVAYSSRNGFFSELTESNCYALRRRDYLDLGGLDERFASPGGGLVNLDFFNIVHQQPGYRPIMLLGEASFHQFHGGVATNVLKDEHPWPRMAAEYAHIRGRPYASAHRAPEYLGWLSPTYHGGLVSLV